MDDGRKVAKFTHLRILNGKAYDCTAIFKIDPSGRITSSSIYGTIGGCNGLVRGKYAP